MVSLTAFSQFFFLTASLIPVPINFSHCSALDLSSLLPSPVLIVKLYCSAGSEGLICRLSITVCKYEQRTSVKDRIGIVTAKGMKKLVSVNPKAGLLEAEAVTFQQIIGFASFADVLAQ